MPDDLISRKAFDASLAEAQYKCKSNGGNFRFGVLSNVRENLAKQPAVDAVPLDKLCEWMNVHCGRPNYCNGRLCGECNLDGEGFEYETCWKILLTEWMEEQQNE